MTVDVSLAEDGDVLVDGYQAPEQVTFPAGEQEIRLGIATEDDALDETDGALTLTLWRKGTTTRQRRRVRLLWQSLTMTMRRS